MGPSGPMRCSVFRPATVQRRFESLPMQKKRPLLYGKGLPIIRHTVVYTGGQIISPYRGIPLGDLV